VIGVQPSALGENVKLPLKTIILPLVYATAAVPQERRLLSELGHHTDTVLPQIKRTRRRHKWSEARLTELATHYTDALADPELNEAERLNYVGDILNIKHPETLRPLIKELKANRRITQPSYQLPITTKRIRFWIRPDSDVNHISFGSDPVIQIDAGDEYQTTDWQTIRQIAHEPELEFEILEKPIRYPRRPGEED
jgi:hypothetical protein